MWFRFDALHDITPQLHKERKNLLGESEVRGDSVRVPERSFSDLLLTLSPSGVMRVRGFRGSGGVVQETWLRSLETERALKSDRDTRSHKTKELKDWKELMKPSEWLNGVDSGLESVIMLMGVFLISILIWLVVKIISKLLSFVRFVLLDLKPLENNVREFHSFSEKSY
jgi:hypothetical protein